MTEAQTFEEWFAPYEQQDLLDDTHYQLASDAWDYQQVEIIALRERLKVYIKEVSHLENIINRQADEKMQLRDELSALRKIAGAANKTAPLIDALNYQQEQDYLALIDFINQHRAAGYTIDEGSEV